MTLAPHNIRATIEKLRPWFHYIDLGHGIVTKTESAIGEPIQHPRPTWEKVKAYLPKDLNGKSVLDVGCNAGFYSIEAKRRGAARVLGVDSQRNLIRQAIFVRDVLGLDIEYRRLSVYDLDAHELGQFDVTLALGLIYHCKHLVLALEKLFTITREILILETAVYAGDGVPSSKNYEVGSLVSKIHPLAYVANPPEAKEAVFNWFLPSIDALCALLKNVGFDSVEVGPEVQSDRAILICSKLEPFPDSRSISYLQANLTFVDGPERSSPNEVVRYKLHARNSGYARWLEKGEGNNDRGAVHLVAHLFADAEQPLSWYHAGAFLPHDVAPGEAVEIEISLRSPEQPGHYEIEFDMVSEQLAWFNDLGSKVVRRALIVE